MLFQRGPRSVTPILLTTCQKIRCALTGPCDKYNHRGYGFFNLQNRQPGPLEDLMCTLCCSFCSSVPFTIDFDL